MRGRLAGDKAYHPIIQTQELGYSRLARRLSLLYISYEDEVENVWYI